MMMDNLDPRDAAREEPAAPRQNPEQEQTLTDREVPLASAHTPEAIHVAVETGHRHVDQQEIGKRPFLEEFTAKAAIPRGGFGG